MTDSSDLGVVAETERLVIRPWHPDEADRAYDIYRRIEVVRWLGPPMTGREEAVALIERLAAGLAADPRFGSWAAVERSSGIPAGGAARVLEAPGDFRAVDRATGERMREHEVVVGVVGRARGPAVQLASQTRRHRNRASSR